MPLELTTGIAIIHHLQRETSITSFLATAQMLSCRQMIAVKYALDQFLAALLLLVLAPILLCIALLIKLDSPGPVLFSQRRVGWRGRTFTIYKFRSMVDLADRLLDERGLVQCNRITRIGKFLRLTSLDELPQLINILLGQMSFIGPRPGPEERHKQLSVWQQRRCEMKPGITGLAQVSGRNTLPWSQRISLDVEYVDHYSWWLDLKILTRTLQVVFTGEGTVLDRNSQQVDDISEMTSKPESKVVELLFHRVEPELIGHYRKDAAAENLLKTLNASLADAHDQDLLDLEESLSTIHVIGAPRSGTTLLTQLISSTIDVGYINNLIASFWRVPCYGIRLSQKLMPDARPSTFNSDFGRTADIKEPHEFGYFWSYFLGNPEMKELGPEFEQSIDWPRLRRVLLNMSRAFGKPIVFKSFLLAWHMERMRELMPKSIFLWIRRDPIDNALSILKAREAQLGSPEKWLSIKPREYSWLKNQPIPMQVAGQVFFVERAIAGQFERLGKCNALQLNYAELCESPQTVLDQIKCILGKNEQDVRQIKSAPTDFAISTVSTQRSRWYDEVKRAINDLEQGRWNDLNRMPAAA